jgi:hypothetical protein
VQHAAMAAGGIVSSRLLTTDTNGQLEGMVRVVGLASALVVVAMGLLVYLAKYVKHHEH